MRGMPMMGGRMMANEGGIMDMDRQTILKGIRDGVFTFDDLTKYDEREMMDINRQTILKGIRDGVFTFDDLTKYDERDRVMANKGGIMMASAPDPMDARNDMMENIAREEFGKPLKDLTEDEIIQIEEMMDEMTKRKTSPRVMAQEGGMIDMGGMEKDYRNEGGFVAIGGQERADDVPARLSKNEFVFTADAVRNAGGGNIDKGAEIMENMMENLEAGGKVSEESQGLQGARAMFATQKRLGEVL
jgi:hypothetical protein